MSSATSINGTEAEGLSRPAAKDGRAEDTLRPWHFFVLVSLVAATAAVILAKEAGPEHLVLISLTIGAAGFAGAALYRTLSPLVRADARPAAEGLSESMRAVLEREKMLVLRSIKELEFDRAMGKLSEKDFEEMGARLRARALSLMRQLDAGGGYRELIERELKARVSGSSTRPAREKSAKSGPEGLPVAAKTCACGVSNDLDATFCKRCGTKLALILCLLLTASIASAQMPDPRQMSGIARPDPQLQNGVVTVRVIRGSFDNPVVSLTVELVGPSPAMRATTDDAGRAEFKGVPAGTRLKASATVAGERIESQEFSMPGSGGIRLALVAAGPAGSPSAPPAAAADPGPVQPGKVVLGEDSRFIFEMGEDGLSVFYVLQINNSSQTRVEPSTPVVFELPAMARGAAVLQGSAPEARVAGRRLEIRGPFAPGNTLVQVAYTVPFGSADLVIEQPLPIELKHVAVVAQKVGDMQLSSPQVRDQQTMPANGNLYIAGRGDAVAANSVLRFAFSGMPHASVWPRNVALGLALLILAGGAWSAFRGAAGGTARDGQRRELEARRDRLFDELTALEASHRDGKSDPEHYGTRRRELVAALESIYAALDDEAVVSRAS